MNQNFEKFKGRMTEIKEWLLKEFATLRTGRASVAILDSVRVQSYGTQVPLNQVATINSEDARTLKITPYDKNQAKDIEKSIIISDLGVSVVLSDAGIRVIFPELTAERRELLVKQAHKKLEESRISVRQERTDFLGDLKKQETEGIISKDERFRAEDEMQKIVDSVQKELEALTKTKEQEIKS